MLVTLLEASEGLNPMYMGVIALALLLIPLIWVIGMGSGRPHSK
ncbi:hypothetical protein [Tessaracoccus caeni]|nr:hypothetical protein [Tessaracoccus caeni]MDF1490022.1 hypothetical protein [Tessaracoccus caeni]